MPGPQYEIIDSVAAVIRRIHAAHYAGSYVRAEERSSEAVVAKKRLEGRGVKGRRSSDTTHRLPAQRGVIRNRTEWQRRPLPDWRRWATPGGYGSKLRSRVASRDLGRLQVRCVNGERNPGQHTLLAPTAGCGKPHVRWYGRGNVRNPVTSTRSRTILSIASTTAICARSMGMATGCHARR